MISPGLLQMHCERFLCILRILGTTLFGVSLLLGISAAYIVGYQFIQTDNYYFSFGLYGAILASHLIIQSLFAFLEHRKMKRSLETPIKLNKTVALCIAAYQEDPDYLRKCLLSVKRLTYPGIKVIMVIDGNSEDDVYMMDIFSEIMGRDKSATYIWRNNFHQRGPDESEETHKESMQHVTQLVLSNKSVCIMQKWGGKREVMYTAFKALGRSVDYVQVSMKSPPSLPRRASKESRSCTFCAGCGIDHPSPAGNRVPLSLLVTNSRAGGKRSLLKTIETVKWYTMAHHTVVRTA